MTGGTGPQLAASPNEIYRFPGSIGTRRAEDRMASGPDLRIGDAERDVTTRQLRECFAQGRLTMDEFNDRLGQALAATTQGELDRLTHDLPPTRPSPAPLPHTVGYRGDPRYAYNPGRDQGGWQGASAGCGTR